MLAIIGLLSFTMKAQYFYHHEHYLNDTAFIIKNNIKVVNIRIPEIMGDTSASYHPYQKLCYNPYGKLAWYEYDYIEHNSRRKFYYLYYYNDQALRFKSRIFQRCDGIDSLREEVRYMYDGNKRLIREDHYQIFIQAYNEWAYSYYWEGDSLRIRSDELGGLDTTRLNTQGLETEYTYDNLRCQTEYHPDGKRKSSIYYWKNPQDNEMVKNNEIHYFYDESDNLTRVETDDLIITYEYDDKGLPIMSSSVNKNGSMTKTYKIYYDYEFRDSVATKTN